MAERNGHHHYLTTTVRNVPGYAGNVCLRILATSVISQSDGRYRKVRAIAHDGREFRGWVKGEGQNPMIVPRCGPLRITLFVSGRRVVFDYNAPGQVPDAQLAADKGNADRPATQPEASRIAADELWSHVKAVIAAVPIKDDADLSRIRKAVGLLFHSEAATNKVALEVLARANAAIDSLSRPRAA